MMFDYEVFCEQLADESLPDDELSSAFTVGLPALVTNGNLQGLRILSNIIKAHPQKWNNNNVALKEAVSYENHDVALAMTRVLKEIYDQDSNTVIASIQNAIMHGRSKAAIILLEGASNSIKERCLFVLVASFSETDDDELRECMVEIFQYMSNGSIYYSPKHLYSHILNHSSLYFVDYFARHHKDVIKQEKLMFCAFACDTESTHFMISKLIDAGASLEWLTPEHWGIALESHKETLEERNSERFSLLLYNDRVCAKDIVSSHALRKFVDATVPLLFTEENNKADDVSTLIMLARNGFLEVDYVINTITGEQIKADNSEIMTPIELLCNAISMSSTKFAFLSTALLIKAGKGMEALENLVSGDDETRPILFTRAAKGIPEFDDNLFEYLTVYDGVIEIISRS